MANDILKTLQAMEDELAAIKSAKEQVEVVVAADTAINSSLKSYANTLSSLSGKLNLIKESLEGVAITVDDETGKFTTSLNARKADIESATNKLSDLLNEFKTQTEVLGIRAIAEKAQQIQLVCEGMKTKLSELELKQQNTTTLISQSVDSSNANLKKHIDNAKDIISKAIENKTSEIDSSVSSLGTEVKHSISTIDSALASKSTEILNKTSAAEASTERTIKKEVMDIKNIQNTSEQNIKTAISSIDKKQMWIGLVLIVLVCIDIILHFI